MQHDVREESPCEGRILMDSLSPEWEPADYMGSFPSPSVCEHQVDGLGDCQVRTWSWLGVDWAIPTLLLAQFWVQIAQSNPT